MKFFRNRSDEAMDNHGQLMQDGKQLGYWKDSMTFDVQGKHLKRGDSDGEFETLIWKSLRVGLAVIDPATPWYGDDPSTNHLVFWGALRGEVVVAEWEDTSGTKRMQVLALTTKATFDPAKKQCKLLVPVRNLSESPS